MTTTVLTSVVTRDLLPEYELFRASFRIYHGYDPVSLIHCDRPSLERLEAMPSTHAIAAVAEISRPRSQWSAEFRRIVRHKIEAVTDAWRIFAPDGVLYVDADLIATAAFMPLLDRFRKPLTLSPHYWTYDVERHNEQCGVFNAGLLLIRDPRFCDWWLDAFDRRPDLFADQRCLNDASAMFDTGHFPPEWNVGYWRRRSHADVPPVDASTLLLHAHVLAPARPDNEFEVGQKRFVAAAMEMLRQRGAAGDERLIAAIKEARR